jgi:hypothetical protein
VRRGATDLGELWRRSGGTLQAAAPAAVRAVIRAQLEPVTSWEGFLTTSIALDPATFISEQDRSRLLALPGSVRVFGDMVPLYYELGPAGGVVRLQLREGQARRLTESDLPKLDRPLHFAVLRGNRTALEADSLEALRARLHEAGEEERRSRIRGPRHRRRR